MSDYVFDASALLALILNEAGEAEVGSRLAESRQVSAVNLTEIFTRLLDLGYSDDDAVESLAGLQLEVFAFDGIQARIAGLLRSDTRSLGLSLGDRCCLALAKHLGCPAVTADRTWLNLDIGIEIISVRSRRAGPA